MNRRSARLGAWTVRSVMLALATGAALAGSLAGLSGCGGGSDEPIAVSDFPPRYSPPPDARPGGELRVLAAGDVDSLDPGALQGQFAGILSFATQRTLLAARLAPGKGFEPDVAARMPKVDRLAGTVDFWLRRDVRFSPPVSRPVRAADFKYALERGLMPGVANGYLKVFLPGLEGLAVAEREAERKPTRAPEISGVKALGPWHLRLQFEGSVPPLAVSALSLPFAAAVPREYAATFDRQVPSTYGLHAVASGPYMVANDSEGNLTGYQPNVKIQLVRNPEWNPASDFRPAFVDSIRVESGYANTDFAARQILTGDSAINGDFGPGPAVLLEAVKADPGQLMMIPSGAVLYAALNTTVSPLDKVNVRRAVVAATNREAMRLARGGRLAGELATHFIPPGVPGFEEAGGFAGPAFDFLAHPEGDLDLAADYMRKAGYPDGTYTGSSHLTMVTSATDFGRRTAEVVRQAFESLEIPVTVQVVSRDVMYSRFCNVPAAAVAVCPDVGWIQELDDPQTLLSQTFDGAAIQSTGNSNWPQLNVPRVNRAMSRAERIYDPARRAKAWGRIDRMVTGLAPAIPNVWLEVAVISSSNVANVISSSLAATALPMASLKDPGPDEGG